MAEKKVALITGSTAGGMGRSIALTLAKNNFDIILNYGTNLTSDKHIKRAEEVKSLIHDIGGNAILIKADTKNKGEISQLFQEALDYYGRIDILVNNAGGMWNPADITQLPEEQLNEVIQSEVMGAIYCIQEALPVMRKNKWGRIINIGAFDAGHWAAQKNEPLEYAIGKGARTLITRHLSLKERYYNITVNQINPGPGHTAHIDSIKEAYNFANNDTGWEKRKYATPQDIAEAVLFLCSEKARFITGSYINFSIE